MALLGLLHRRSALVACACLSIAACAIEHQAAPEAQPQARALAKTSSSEPQLVWVTMKDQADLEHARTISDWAERGAAVRDALRATAKSKQDPLQRLLAARALSFESYWIVNALRVRADADTIEQLRSRPDVASVSAEQVYSIPRPQPGASDASSGSNSRSPWGLASIRAREAWQSFGSHGEGIVIGSIDTGVQFDHPALSRQYRGAQNGAIDHNYNWFDPSRVCGNPAGAPCDNSSHGTHTMGTLVGLDESGEHPIGVAPGARWITAKGCEDVSYCSYDALLKSAQWMLAPTDLNGANPRPDLRPNIISNSWSGGSGDTWLRQIVQAWVAAGIFPVFAAGNGGPACGTVASPSDYPESYSVAAYDGSETIALFSARGSGNVGAPKPNIAAPGVDVVSSWVGNGYYAISGTSMATPHVAGAIALLWSAVPGLRGDVAATRALLDKSAVDMGDWNCGGDTTDNATWGEGRLDVYAALMNAGPQPARGLLLGKVSASAKAPGMTPVATVVARAAGQTDRFIVANDDGSYQLALPVGTYSIEVHAFGYATKNIEDVVIDEAGKAQQNIALEPLPRASITGVVVDDNGAPIPFASVSAIGVPLAPVETDPTGHYTIDDVPQGSYVLRFEANGCYEPKQLSVSLPSPSTIDATLARRYDKFGYGCQALADKQLTGNQRLLSAGDDESRPFDLPFPFVYYGKEYKQVTVSINGALTFEPKPVGIANRAIPSAELPNAAIYALWHDYILDDASAVFTQVLGAAPRRQAVIEWRNVPVNPYEGIAQRFNFAIVLDETGEITLQYGSSGTASHYGELATIGIEDEHGSDGLMYSLSRASVVPGMSIRYATPGSSVVRGTIKDENDGKPVAGAEVAAMSGNQSRLRVVSSDVQGNFLLQAPAGTARVAVNGKHYVKQERPLTVGSSRNTRMDFTLQTAVVSLEPTSVELVVPAGQSKTRQFTLKNSGSAPLAWSFQQSATEHSPGEVIRSFKTTQPVPWGIGLAEKLWVAALFDSTNVELDNDGTPTGRAWPAERLYVSLDMAYDTRHKLMCQVDHGVGYSIGLPCWDPNTGKLERTIAGDYLWTAQPQRGVAYSPEDDSFYIGGAEQGVIYHIAGFSHDHPGEILSQCQPPDPQISGLAWNASKHVLWEATNSDLDSVYALDPEDCSVLSVIAHPAPGKNGGGLEVDQHGDLWMVAQTLSTVYLVASGVPTFSRVPWLSTTPDSNTLVQGVSTTVTLTVNSADLKAGGHDATLFLESDAARAPSLRVPIRLIVTDYQRAIDSGGEQAYTDAELETWSADRPYVPGEWGYVGDTGSFRSQLEIADTDDPALYQSLRLDASGYRFDDVPNGVYAVELRFAQPSDLDHTQHEFDVIVEDELVLPAYDPAYRSGTDHADDHSFFVPVADGQLDIRFATRVGSPIINALRVTHRPDR